MSTVRLSVGIKEVVERELLSYRFAEDASALVEDYAVLALDVYNDIYPETDRAKMERLPKGWLPAIDAFKVEFAGEIAGLSFRGKCHGSIAQVRGRKEPLGRGHVVPHSDQSRVLKQYEARHELSERHAELERRWDQLEADIRAARTGARAAMDSVTTVKRLVEVWPEVAPFVARYEKQPNTLPAVPRADLNAALGLPKENAA